MTELSDAAAKAAEFIENLANDMGDPGWAVSIWRAARDLLPTPVRKLAPGENAPNGWRFRIILFRPDGSAEADTNPDWPVEADPVEPARTLPDIAQALEAIAVEFHAGSVVEGLDRNTLSRAISGLRVSLTRNGGACWWNRPYSVDGAWWKASVRVVRAS